MKPTLRFLSFCSKTGALGFCLSATSLLAANFTWDSDTSTTGIQEGSGTGANAWTPTSNNFWNTTTGNANGTPVAGDQITFGNGAGAAGFEIVLSNGGSNLVYATNNDNAITSSLIINRSYSFSGDGLSIGNIDINNGSTVTFNNFIDGGASVPDLETGTKSWNVKGGSTLNLNGGGSLQHMANGSTTASTVNITGGTWSVGGFNTAGVRNGNANLGGGGSEARILTINQSAGTTITGTGNFNIGGMGGSNADTRTTYNLNGGTLDTVISLGAGGGGTAGALSQAILNVNSGTVTATGHLRVANDGGSGILNVSGGTVTSNNLHLARRGNTGGAITATVNITGGVTKVNQIQFGDNQSNFATGSNSSLNLRGGSLYVGNGHGGNSIFVEGSNPNLTTTITLSGGTLGATQAWSSTMTMTLSNADGGVTIRAADDTGTSRAITLNGTLQGTGGFTKTGGGNLFINGASNTYSGGTLITTGAIYTGTSGGALGTGDVIISAGAGLVIQNGNSIGDLATLFIDITAGNESALNLYNTTTETVGAIVVTSSGNPNVYVEGGRSYTASQLFSLYGIDALGGGQIFVAIPEPSVIALSGLLPLALLRRRRA